MKISESLPWGETTRSDFRTRLMRQELFDAQGASCCVGIAISRSYAQDGTMLASGSHDGVNCRGATETADSFRWR